MAMDQPLDVKDNVIWAKFYSGPWAGSRINLQQGLLQGWLTYHELWERQQNLCIQWTT